MGNVEYRQTSGSGENDRWYEDARTSTGIGKGPASDQDRIRLVLIAEVDPNSRIKLPKQKGGAGWCALLRQPVQHHRGRVRR
jgi:hypothetical protein